MEVAPVNGLQRTGRVGSRRYQNAFVRVEGQWKFPRDAQRGCCRADPDRMSESHSEPDIEFVRDGRNSRKESKKGGREIEVRNSQEKRP
jgi:hypothetical protein